MSSRFWSVKSERDIVSNAVANVSMMMLDRSYSSAGTSSIGIMLLQSFPALLLFIWGDREVGLSINTIEDVIIPPIKAYSNYIYTPIVDTTISFNPMGNMISDFNNSQCYLLSIPYRTYTNDCR
jgi:hypothetical protein